MGKNFLKENDIITLVEGEFEVENGLYTEIQKCPAIWNPELKEYDSIYHLFDNNFDNWLDCEIINNLPWSEISCPIDGVSYYDHITCNTSLGLLKYYFSKEFPLKIIEQYKSKKLNLQLL